MPKKVDKYHIVNYMEELVHVTLRGLLSEISREESPSKREEVDIKALALNRLWPMYVTTPRGRRFVEQDVVTDKIDRDVTRELKAAIDIVRKRPKRP